MLADYPHVFSPVRIGPMEVANRVFLPPHGIPLTAAGPHGTQVPSDDFAWYYAERAAAGVALLGHSLTISPLPGGLACPVYPESVPSFAKVAEVVHEHGARIFGQLHYSSLTSGPWEPLSPKAPVLGPSSLQRHERYDTCHAMGRDEIRRLVELYGTAARHLRQAGYDGVEIHAAHGVLMEQFLSPYFNRRDDEYGGSAAGRMRLLIEALQAVRDGAGTQTATGVRLVCTELLAGGLAPEDIQEIAAELAQRELIDFADMDIAVEPHQPQLMTTPSLLAPMHLLDQVATVRKALPPRVAVISSLGRVTTVAQAEQALAAGAVDMVGAARGLIAEPELIRNAREGHEDRSRTCIACNHCIASVQRPGGGYGCAINPATGRERRWGVGRTVPAPRTGLVVVAGAGPAGLEAARVAALRGHRVVVLESRSGVGGQLDLWAGLPGRENYRGFVDWSRDRLRELGVTVHTGVAADPERILELQPDAVVVATGARYAAAGGSGYAPDPIPGWDRDFVHLPEQVLEGGARPGGVVLVLDEEGINTGPGVAEILARQGARVRLVTRHPQLMGNLAFDGHAPILLPRLRELGVEISTQTYVGRIDDHRVVLVDVVTGAEQVVDPVNAVVLATMRLPETDLAARLAGSAPQVFAVGDALAPRGLAEATFEGQRFARLIGEPGAPRTTGEALLLPAAAEAFPRPAAAMGARR